MSAASVSASGAGGLPSAEALKPSLSIAARIPALRARRLPQTWAPSSPERRMMSARSASSLNPSSVDNSASDSHGVTPDQRGFVLPERMYPVRIPPSVNGSAPLPFTLAITRQESSFDPRARSHADARGMMQFLPSTASGVARRLGMSFSAEQLWDPDYNMTLGSYHLGELMNQFSGSMLLTTVGYNAGPARPPQWIVRCGDPRGAQVDPVDFIECAPFTETRNYMMRVMENVAVYKARLNGGVAPLTPSADISRGAAAGPRPYAAY